MRWSPVMLAAALAASLPRLAAAQPAEPAAAEPAADGTDSSTGDEQAEQAETTDQASTATAAPAPRAPATPEDGDEPIAPPVPPALDTLGGHVAASISAGLVVPFGDLAHGTSQSGVMSTGSGFGLELGYGVSRTVVIGAWGQYAHFGSGSDCSACTSTGFAVGPFVRYHLVQGVRFDPWLEAGVGFRSMHVDNKGQSAVGVPQGGSSWSGIQWVRVAVGGDWYAFSKLGLGPFMSLGMTTYGSRPSGAGGSAAAWQFSLGARITFDVPGK